MSNDKQMNDQSLSTGRFTYKLSRKYLYGMIVGLILEYIGLIGIVLGNTDVISKESIIYSGGAMIEVAGVFWLLFFTYKLCKVLEFSLIKSLLISVINASIGINLLVPLPYLIFKTLKIKASQDTTIESPKLQLEDNHSSSPKQKFDGYVGSIIIFIAYSNIMLRKQSPDDITPLAYIVGNISELIGLIPLFLIYLTLRKKMIRVQWFSNKNWIASLISGIISLFVISNLIILIPILLSQLK